LISRLLGLAHVVGLRRTANPFKMSFLFLFSWKSSVIYYRTLVQHRVGHGLDPFMDWIGLDCVFGWEHCDSFL